MFEDPSFGRPSSLNGIGTLRQGDDAVAKVRYRLAVPPAGAGPMRGSMIVVEGEISPWFLEHLELQLEDERVLSIRVQHRTNGRLIRFVEHHRRE